MKHPGCILEFTEQRNKELMRAFRMAIQECTFIDIAKISERIVNTPCARFWVSEERAMVVIQAIIKGKPILNTMRPTKKEMFLEIYKRVNELQKQKNKKSLAQIISKVVNQPAPKFYMKPRCAMEIIYKIKKQK